MRLFFLLLSAIVCVCAGAQTTHRDSVLTEARYLKSVFRTDEAIGKLSGLVTPEVFDEDVMAELADCHFQSGDYESASGTYFLLASRAPGNIIYKIRQMQIYSRLKAWPNTIQAGKAALQLDSIPAVMGVVGDAFRQMEQSDSALWYYRRSLALRPRNTAVLSKAMDILISKEHYDEAISLATPFLAEDPDNHTIAPLQGLAHFRKADYDTAVDIFQHQEDIGNDIYPIHYYLGQSYWRTKVIYRAEQELIAAWQIDSSDVNLAYYIAAVKSEAYRPFEEDVKPWLDKAWDMIQPDAALMSRLHQQYGLGYYKKRETWDKAIEHYKEAYRYNPKLISTLTAIAYCYELQKDYKHALEWYDKYLNVARPGTTGYEFSQRGAEYAKGELFMNEKK